MSSLLLIDLPEEVLEHVLSLLPPPDLIRAAQACRKLSQCAEQVCFRRTAKRGQRMPRRPRGFLAVAQFPKRYFYLQHLCVNCRQDGEWILRQFAVQVGLACKKCLVDPDFQARMERHLLKVDVISRRGAKLKW